MSALVGAVLVGALAPPAVPTSATGALAAAPLQDFMAYNPAYTGGVFVATGDIDGDGRDEIVTAPGPGGGPHVRVWRDDGTGAREITGFYAYDPAFSGGVRVATGDIDGDGRDEVVTAPGGGGGPHVRVLSWNGTAFTSRAEFYAYDPGYSGGVFVAAGDVDNDGRAEVVTGPDQGGGPHVRAIHIAANGNLSEVAGFYAYNPDFGGGVRVAVANTGGDARAEIVTAPGPGGGPHVRVIEVASLTEQAGFYAYDPSFSGGVYPAAANLDDDAPAEVVTGPGAGGGPYVRAFDVSASATVASERYAYSAGFSGGVRVTTGVTRSDGQAQIVTAPGPGGGPHVRLFDFVKSPGLAVTTLVAGLDIPWDVVEAPGGEIVFTQRGSGLYVFRNGSVHALATPADLWVNREAGMMGLELDPGFGTSNRTAYTCQGYKDGGGNPVDVRVVRWTIASDWSAATPAGPVVTGIPMLLPSQPETGTHVGCSVRMQPGSPNVMFVTTGDAFTPTAPQDLGSLGGKTLRVRTDSVVNTPAPGNPFGTMVYTYGHRNVQGVTFRPGTNEPYTAEHGPSWDDEVNKLVAGGNYGWNPADGSGNYFQGVPMTDPSLPNVVPAIWSSGTPTLATSGLTFVSSPAWLDWDGALVVACLKTSQLLVFRLQPGGTSVEGLGSVLRDHGRLRTPRPTRDGRKMLVTTSNSTGTDHVDEILLVTPG